MSVNNIETRILKTETEKLFRTFYLYTGIIPFLFILGLYLYIGITLSVYNISKGSFLFNSQFSRKKAAQNVQIYKL